MDRSHINEKKKKLGKNTAKFNMEPIIEIALRYCPALGDVFNNVKFGTQGTGIASADMNMITYNPAEMKKLSPDKQAFVMAHEGLHILWGDVLAGDSQFDDGDVLNRAYDPKVNSYLVEVLGMTAPDNCIFIRGAHRASIKDIYDMYKKQQRKGKKLREVKDMKDKDAEQYIPGGHDRWGPARKNQKQTMEKINGR